MANLRGWGTAPAVTRYAQFLLPCDVSLTASHSRQRHLFGYSAAKAETNGTSTAGV